MTLAELTTATSTRSGRKQHLCDRVIRELLKLIVARAAAGDMVQIRRRMTFYAKTRKPRPARNPRTGEPVQLTERRVLLCRWPGRRVP